jgi:hypothetical protein
MGLKPVAFHSGCVSCWALVQRRHLDPLYAQADDEPLGAGCVEGVSGLSFWARHGKHDPDGYTPIDVSSCHYKLIVAAPATSMTTTYTSD